MEFYLSSSWQIETSLVRKPTEQSLLHLKDPIVSLKLGMTFLHGKLVTYQPFSTHGTVRSRYGPHGESFNFQVGFSITRIVSLV